MLPVLRRSTTERTGDTAWERSPRVVSDGANLARAADLGKETAQRPSGPRAARQGAKEIRRRTLWITHPRLTT